MTLPGEILIVDDDADVRETLRELLEAEGYRCAAAADGQAALVYLGGSAPSLILLDLMMPVMDGFDFRKAQLANESWREIPVIVVSASGRSKPAAREMAAADYLEKPIDVAQLLQKVQELGSFAASRAGSG